MTAAAATTTTTNAATTVWNKTHSHRYIDTAAATSSSSAFTNRDQDRNLGRRRTKRHRRSRSPSPPPLPPHHPTTHLRRGTQSSSSSSSLSSPYEYAGPKSCRSDGGFTVGYSSLADLQNDLDLLVLGGGVEGVGNDDDATVDRGDDDDGIPLLATVRPNRRIRGDDRDRRGRRSVRGIVDRDHRDDRDGDRERHDNTLKETKRNADPSYRGTCATCGAMPTNAIIALVGRALCY